MRLRRSSAPSTRAGRVAHQSPKNQKVHSYYTARRFEQPIEIDMQRRRPLFHLVGNSARSLSWHATVWLVAFTCLVSAWATIRLSRTPIIRFSRNDSRLAVNHYAEGITDILQSSVLSSSKLTIQKSSIESQIIKRFPELSRAQVATSVLGRQPIITIEVAYMPILLQSSGKEYVVNDAGVAVAERSSLPGVTPEITVKDESSEQVVIGEKILRSRDIVFIKSFVELSRQQGRAVDQVRYTGTPREIWVKPTAYPYQLRLSTEGNVREQFGSWLATEKAVGEAGQTVTEYIDTRAGEKVFYK